MAPSSSPLSQMLRSVSSAKLDELSRRRALFEHQKAAIFKEVGASPLPRDRVRILLDALKSLPGSSPGSLGVAVSNRRTLIGVDSDDEEPDSEWSNMKQFLGQSQHDSPVSSVMLADWERKLRQDIEREGLKYEYATLFGEILTEWSSEQNSQTAAAAGIDTLDAFEEIGGKDSHEYRELFESYVFTAHETDTVAIESYLETLFSSTPESKKALEDLRDEIKEFGEDELPSVPAISETNLEQCIDSLLATDMLTNEKKTMLADLWENDVLTAEVGDILRLRLASLDTWSWGKKAVPVEARQGLDGKYEIYEDEDILQAIFLHYLGVRWGSTFKKHLIDFSRTPAWKPLSKLVPVEYLRRRAHFLNDFMPPPPPPPPPSQYVPPPPPPPPPSWSPPPMPPLPPPPPPPSMWLHSTIQTQRRADFSRHFMTQLPSYPAGPRRCIDLDVDYLTAKSETLHQALPHLVATESLIHTSIHGHFTVLRSGIKWFGLSLPHSTILTVLEFFGVPGKWLSFFKKFLECPVKFTEDGPDGLTQTRVRGVPASHALSVLFGEVLLFCMDYAVNQGADGALLYRLHDDFWVWGQENTCVEAWDAVKQFAKIMGVSFDKEKTGTAQISQNKAKPKSLTDRLPKGEVRWGMLQLDPTTGQFVVDQKQVDTHTKELKLKLSACKSILAWVRTWNTYMEKLFADNFAEPAHCLGRGYVDTMIKTFERFQRELFTGDAANGGATEYLRAEIAKRFGVANIPDGFIYFPAQLGGIELHNPLINLYAVRNSVSETPARAIEKAIADEEALHRRKRRQPRKSMPPLPGGGVFTLEELRSHREDTSSQFGEAYKYLLTIPAAKVGSPTPELTAALDRVPYYGDCGVESDWRDMGTYYQSVVRLYGADLLERIGSLTIVEERFLPASLVDLFREKRQKREIIPDD